MPAATSAAKVRRGLYEIRNVTHTLPRYPGAPACGGQVFAEWFPGEGDSETGPDGCEREYKLPASWECFCDRCGNCDFNGWSTLAECMSAAPEFWMGVTDAGRE